MRMFKQPKKVLVLPFTLGVCVMLAYFSPVHAAATPTITGMLSGTDSLESPTASGEFTLVGDMLHAEINVKGSVPPASVSMHGIAESSWAAPRIFSFSSAGDSPQSGYNFSGDFILSPRQSSDLLAGQWYVYIASRTAINRTIRFHIIPGGPGDVQFTSQLIYTNATPPSPDPSFATGSFELTKQPFSGFTTKQIVLGCSIQYYGYLDLPFGPSAFIQGPVNGTNQTIFILNVPFPPPPRIGFGPHEFSQAIPQDSFSGAFVLSERQKEDLLKGSWSVCMNIGVTGSPSYQYAIRGQILPVDSDNDGVPDYRDFYPNTPPGEVVNSLGGSIDQICPCDANWRNHGEYVARIQNTVLEFEKDRLITATQGLVIFQQAENSDCGKHSVGWFYLNRE